ncbi:unnamed protein product [Adineta steineri]|uniref:Uncharacterized protein n=1 Tax=Adineta steineri TaxID=433720 RepID=A0A815IED7_9BILA|nr:unnamed protein product [Adineta steineri]
MEHSFDIPREPHLSNSIFKNRPIPHPRARKTPTTKITQTTDHNDAVPFDDANTVENSNEQPPSINRDNDDYPVTFRPRNAFSSNRINNLAYLSQGNDNTDSVSLDPPNTTLFYITSSIPDDNSITTSNSPSTSNRPSLLEHDEKNLLDSEINQKESQVLLQNKSNIYPSLESMYKKPSSTSILIDDFANRSMNNDENSCELDRTTAYLEQVRENLSNCQCADCNSEYPTIAIMSWLLVICKNCANVHRLLTSDFLRLQSLLTTACDPYLIDLLCDYGNEFSNSLLENETSQFSKPNDNSSEFEREQYIRKKYIEKIYLRSNQSNYYYTQYDLNKMLYENVETTDCGKTLHLIMLGADPNYSEKMFPVADHAKRHQQIKQLKIILANGGQSEFDLMKTNSDEKNETIAYLSSKHGVLKEFRTYYENNRLKVSSPTSNSDKSQRYLFEIDLNNILAICNQSVNAVSLKCRLTNPPVMNVNSQCILIVDEETSTNEYVWVFPNDFERSIWIHEIIKREYSYHQLIYPNFILLMKLNVQEGMNAEKQQVIAIVYSGRFVICSDTIYDEVDLRKYSSLTYQKSKEFTGVVLCLISNRFLYLSSPIIKLTDMLYSCLREAIQVRTLTDLNKQILTSQNIPVIVERFINFIFEHGLQTKGIYRQAGQETKVKQLLNECLEDPYNSLLTYENYTEHDVANALKRFLRHLDMPLLGSRQNYYAWLRSIVDKTITHEQLIQYYRALIKDLKQHFPIHYATLRVMIIHIHTVAALADRNGMTLTNLISTFAPCLVSQGISVPMDNKNNTYGYRNRSLDDLNSKDTNENDTQESFDLNNSPLVTKLKRNQSIQARRQSIATISNLSQFPMSSAYLHVTPTIQADLKIMSNLCIYYCELFDITYEEIEHEKHCIETLISITENQPIPRILNGTMISVYFESRADELNGYAMNICEEETTADMIIDKLLKRINQNDSFFWALFEVIIDQNLERPMYACENISEVLYRYRTYLSHQLNRQATFVVKLNYIQFEKERLEQRSYMFNNQSVQCEYFDISNQRWTPCVWISEKAVLQIHRVSNNSTNDKVVKWKSSLNQQDSDPSILFDKQTLIKSWPIENLYLYIGADCRIVNPFDMNEYRVLTILPPEIIEQSHNESPYGISFRFADRNQMFSWYLELVHISGHDKWTRRASRTMPNGISYLPLQNYHTSPSSSPPSALSRKKSDPMKNKFISKSRHIASNLCKQLRK